MVTKYIGSMIAKRVLKNRPDLHKKFDDAFDNQTDLTSSVDSRIDQALRYIRSFGKNKKSQGGEIIIKGGDYIKDLL
tara:strand:+ start:1904 stop:2134 length:231 start_codon:yes stop_codon:yes gene_type:complete